MAFASLKVRLGVSSLKTERTESVVITKLENLI